MSKPIVTKEELELRELKLRSLRYVTEDVLNSTIQFYFDIPKPKFHAAGSGVLLNIAEKYFVLTAAHVFTEQHDKLYVIVSEKAISLGGMLYTTPLPSSGNRVDDKIDLAVIEIENEIAIELKAEYKFITLDDILLGHYIDFESRYLSIGYPITQTKKIWGEKRLRIKPFSAILTATKSFDYKINGFSPISHIAIDSSREVVSDTNPSTHLSPSLEGISGSGIWYLPDFFEKDSNYTKKLIGIVIEQISGPLSKSIVATRVDLVTEFLRQYLFLSDIPQSKQIRISVK